MWQFVKKLDIALFYLINRSGQNVFFDALMPVVSGLKYFYIPFGLFWLFLITRKGFKPRSLALGIVLLIGFSEWVSYDLLKPFFGRPRPYDALSDVRCYHNRTGDWSITRGLKEPVVEHSYSLPSCHATNIFAASLLLSYYYRKWWPFLYLAAAMVAYSRVYLGAHYPADVLFGAMVGTLCGISAVWLLKLVGRCFKKKGDQSGQDLSSYPE
ncbi:MAG: phosphatase PAP2 family protein [Desulfobacterales bacterium]|nr:phosphatase PAP2 family protein [Desulfobacterales bacterium]